MIPLDPDFLQELRGLPVTEIHVDYTHNGENQVLWVFAYTTDGRDHLCRYHEDTLMVHAGEVLDHAVPEWTETPGSSGRVTYDLVDNRLKIEHMQRKVLESEHLFPLNTAPIEL